MQGVGTMPQFTQVRVRLHSRHQGEDVVQDIPAEAILRGSTLYIRYEEPQESPLGGTTNVTIKIGQAELKLIRHGEVQSEQSFEEGKRLPGFYRSPYTNFAMSTDTSRLTIQREGLTAHVEWDYELYVYEDLSGAFAISLHIQEEQE